MKDMNAIQRKMKNLFEEYEGIRKKAEGEKRSMNANDIKKRTELKAEIDDLAARLACNLIGWKRIGRQTTNSNIQR